MTRLLLITMLSFSFLGSAMAQDADSELADTGKRFFTEDGRQLRSDEEITAYLAAMEAEKRQKLNSACDGPKAKQTHALIELCAWVGQHR